MDTNHGVDQFPEHDQSFDPDDPPFADESDHSDPVKCTEETCEQNEGYGCQGHAPADNATVSTTSTDPGVSLDDGTTTVAAHQDLDGATAQIEPAKRFKRVLVCKMYPEELAKKAVALAAALTAHEARENEIKEEAKAAREELTGMWEDVKKLSRIVTAGGEEREVECELVRNDREGSIETVRLDTGEVIDRRAQDADERQLPLRPLDRDVTDAGPEKGTDAPEGVDGDQCAVIVDGERCEGRTAAGQVYCPECIADAEAKRDEQEAAAAAARPRCAVGDCEEEAGASGYCGQHDRTEASTSPATPKAKGKGKGKGKGKPRG